MHGVLQACLCTEARKGCHTSCPLTPTPIHVRQSLTESDPGVSYIGDQQAPAIFLTLVCVAQPSFSWGFWDLNLRPSACGSKCSYFLLPLSSVLKHQVSITWSLPFVSQRKDRRTKRLEPLNLLLAARKGGNERRKEASYMGFGASNLLSPHCLFWILLQVCSPPLATDRVVNTLAAWHFFLRKAELKSHARPNEPQFVF